MQEWLVKQKIDQEFKNLAKTVPPEDLAKSESIGRIIKFCLNHERLPLMVKNLTRELTLTELRLGYKFTNKDLTVVLKDFAKQFALMAMQAAEDKCISDIERQRREDLANKPQITEDKLIGMGLIEEPTKVVSYEEQEKPQHSGLVSASGKPL
ncbi:MAG: hypothetical protein E6R04_10705 [Spirochaetes bacterium]|nr:MAG: hypothetical protein E6R04_10705 [Spirochaetota bacterium]